MAGFKTKKGGKLQLETENTIEDLVGSGKTADVYLARVIGTTEKNKALKVLRDDLNEKDEAKTAKKRAQFREEQVGESDSVKRRYGKSHNLVSPEAVVELSDNRVAAVMKYMPGRDVSLLVDIMNNTHGIMSTLKDEDRKKYDGKRAPRTEENFNTVKWQAIAYTISLGVLKGLVSIHGYSKTLKCAHGDLIPSNVLLEGFDIGTSHLNSLSIEEILNLEPSEIKVRLSDMAFDNPAKPSLYSGGEAGGLKISFLELWRGKNPDKRRNPHRRYEDYRLTSSYEPPTGINLDYFQASDIRAAGLITIELLTGMTPTVFEAERLKNGSGEKEFLKKLKGNMIEDVVVETIVSMLYPKNTAASYLKELAAGLNQDRFTVKTNGHFPSVQRAYHNFMHTTRRYNKKLDGLLGKDKTLSPAEAKKQKLPVAEEMQQELYMLHLYQEIERTETEHKEILEKKGLLSGPELKTQIEKYEQIRESYTFLEETKKTLGFEKSDITRSYKENYANELDETDKERIQEEYVKLVEKYDGFVDKYIALFDRQDQMYINSQEIGNNAVKQMEIEQQNALKIANALRKESKKVKTLLKELKG